MQHSAMSGDCTIRLVAFDVFGTIAEGNLHPGPYGRIARDLGVPFARLAHDAQTNDVEVGELIDRLAPSRPEMLRRSVAQQVRHDLVHDLARIRLCPETASVFSGLSARGFEIALVSNLAPPYGERITELLRAEGILPATRIWSYECGSKKPDAAIYEKLFETSGRTPSEILFIGDRADRDLWPPRNLGCQSRLIARPGSPSFTRAISGVSECDRIEDLRDIFTALNIVPSIPPDTGQDRSLRNTPREHTPPV